METNEAIAVGVIVCVLACAGVGLVYVGITSTDNPNSDTVKEASVSGSDAVNDTETVSNSSGNSNMTEAETETDTRGTVTVQGDRVLNASYNEADGSFRITFRVTGANWKTNVYRSDIAVTTLVPEEHTDSNGKTHPTSSHWNTNSSLPESKSYAFVGSRIDSGKDTETATDDEYVVTVVLPTVVQESVRFTLVENGEAVTFFEGSY